MPEIKFNIKAPKLKISESSKKTIVAIKDTVKKGILAVTLVITISWLILGMVLLFIGKGDLFTCNSVIITFTKVAAISAMIGFAMYLSSPSIKKIVRSNLRKVPIMWHKIIDSGYTEYYKPVVSKIVDGIYQQLVDTNIMIDSYGLPIINRYHPLNSFDMNIYLRYFPDTVSLYDKIIKDSIEDNVKDLEAAMKTKYDRYHLAPYAEDIIYNFYDSWRDVMRICGMGSRIIIVSNYLGEYMPVHKAEYKSFILDFYKTVEALPMDPTVQKDKALQRSIILDDINRLLSLEYTPENIRIDHYEMIPVVSELRELAQITDADTFSLILFKILTGPVRDTNFFEQNMKSEDANIIDNAVNANINGHMLDFAIQSFKHNENTIIGYYNETMELAPVFAFNEFVSIANSDSAHSLYKYINNGNSIAFKELNNIVKNIQSKLEEPGMNTKLYEMFKSLGSSNQKIRYIKRIVDKDLKKQIDFHNKKILENSYKKSFSMIKTLSYIINPFNKKKVSTKLAFPTSTLFETVNVEYDNIPKEKRLFHLERQLDTLNKKLEDAPIETQRQIKKQVKDTEEKINKINNLIDVKRLIDQKETEMIEVKNRALSIIKNEMPLNETIQKHLAVLKTELDSLVQTKNQLEASIVDVDTQTSPITAPLANSSITVSGPSISDIPDTPEITIEVNNEEDINKMQEVVDYEQEKLRLEISKQGKEMSEMLHLFKLTTEEYDKTKYELIEENNRLKQINEEIQKQEKDIVDTKKEAHKYKQEIEALQNEMLNKITQSNEIAESERNALVNEIVKSRSDIELVQSQLMQVQQDAMQKLQKEYEDRMVEMQKELNQKNAQINNTDSEIQKLQMQIESITVSINNKAQEIDYKLMEQENAKKAVIKQLQKDVAFGLVELEKAKSEKFNAFAQIEQKHQRQLEEKDQKNIQLDAERAKLLEKVNQLSEMLSMQINERDSMIMEIDESSQRALQMYEQKMAEMAIAHEEQIIAKQKDHDRRIEEIQQQFITEKVKDKKEFESELQVLKTQIETLQEEHNKKLQLIAGDQERTVGENRKFKADYDALVKEMEEKNKMIEKLSESINPIADNQQKIRDLEMNLNITQKQLRDSKSIIDEKSKYYQELLKEHEASKSEKKELIKLHDKQKLMIIAAEVQLESVQSDNEEKSTIIADLKSQIQELSKTSAALEQAKHNYDAVQQENKELKQKLITKEEQLAATKAADLKDYTKLKQKNISQEETIEELSQANKRFLQELQQMKTHMQQKQQSMKQKFNETLQFCMTNKEYYGTSIAINVKILGSKTAQLTIDSDLLKSIINILKKFNPSKEPKLSNQINFLLNNNYVQKSKPSENLIPGISLVGNINGKLLILAKCIRDCIIELNIIGLLQTLDICEENVLLQWVNTFIYDICTPQYLSELVNKVSDKINYNTFVSLCNTFGFKPIGYTDKNIADIAFETPNPVSNENNDLDIPIQHPQEKADNKIGIFDLNKIIGELDGYEAPNNEPNLNDAIQVFFTIMEFFSQKINYDYNEANNYPEYLNELQMAVSNRIKEKINHTKRGESYEDEEYVLLTKISAKLKAPDFTDITPRDNYKSIYASQGGINKLYLTELIIILLEVYKNTLYIYE